MATLNVKRTHRNRMLTIIAIAIGAGVPFLVLFLLGLFNLLLANTYANLGIALLGGVLGALLAWLILIAFAKIYDTKKQHNADLLQIKERHGLVKAMSKTELKEELQNIKALRAEEQRKAYALRKNKAFTSAKKKHAAYID